MIQNYGRRNWYVDRDRGRRRRQKKQMTVIVRHQGLRTRHVDSDRGRRRGYECSKLGVKPAENGGAGMSRPKPGAIRSAWRHQQTEPVSILHSSGCYTVRLLPGKFAVPPTLLPHPTFRGYTGAEGTLRCKRKWLVDWETYSDSYRPHIVSWFVSWKMTLFFLFFF